ncbi:MAG TPA: thiamine phosphate synthase [Dehalococcoidia bacterium]
MPLPTRVGRLRPPVLCFIVSPETTKDIEATVASAVAGGVTMVQLRDKNIAGGQLLETARKLKTITRGKALLIINDRVDVAVAGEADGAELPEDGIPTLAARTLIGKYAVLGRSVHSVEGAVQAGREGAEFVIAGTIYKSPSKPDAKAAGPSLISDITGATNLPVLAIGGVTAKNVGDVIKAGAAGVAVISAIAGAEDPRAAAEELSKALSEAWAEAKTSALSA